jgi:hypothetical protein
VFFPLAFELTLFMTIPTGGVRCWIQSDGSYCAVSNCTSLPELMLPKTEMQTGKQDVYCLTLAPILELVTLPPPCPWRPYNQRDFPYLLKMFWISSFHFCLCCSSFVLVLNVTILTCAHTLWTWWQISFMGDFGPCCSFSAHISFPALVLGTQWWHHLALLLHLVALSLLWWIWI